MLCQHYVPIVRFMHLQPTSSFKCPVLVQIIKCEPTFNKDIQPYIYTNCCFNYEFKILPKSNRTTFNLFFFLCFVLREDICKIMTLKTCVNVTKLVKLLVTRKTAKPIIRSGKGLLPRRGPLMHSQALDTAWNHVLSPWLLPQFVYKTCTWRQQNFEF